MSIYCDWSDLPRETCAHCRGVEAPEVIEAAGDALDRKGDFE